jgi:hypothetical protein
VRVTTARERRERGLLRPGCWAENTRENDPVLGRVLEIDWEQNQALFEPLPLLEPDPVELPLGDLADTGQEEEKGGEKEGEGGPTRTWVATGDLRTLSLEPGTVVYMGDRTNMRFGHVVRSEEDEPTCTIRWFDTQVERSDVGLTEVTAVPAYTRLRPWSPAIARVVIEKGLSELQRGRPSTDRPFHQTDIMLAVLLLCRKYMPDTWDYLSQRRKQPLYEQLVDALYQNKQVLAQVKHSPFSMLVEEARADFHGRSVGTRWDFAREFLTGADEAISDVHSKVHLARLIYLDTNKRFREADLATALVSSSETGSDDPAAGWTTEVDEAERILNDARLLPECSGDDRENVKARRFVHYTLGNVHMRKMQFRIFMLFRVQKSRRWLNMSKGILEDWVVGQALAGKLAKQTKKAKEEGRPEGLLSAADAKIVTDRVRDRFRRAPSAEHTGHLLDYIRDLRGRELATILQQQHYGGETSFSFLAIKEADQPLTIEDIQLRCPLDTLTSICEDYRAARANYQAAKSFAQDDVGLKPHVNELQAMYDFAKLASALLVPGRAPNDRDSGGDTLLAIVPPLLLSQERISLCAELMTQVPSVPSSADPSPALLPLWAMSLLLHYGEFCEAESEVLEIIRQRQRPTMSGKKAAAAEEESLDVDDIISSGLEDEELLVSGTTVMKLVRQYRALMGKELALFFDLTMAGMELEAPPRAADGSFPPLKLVIRRLSVSNLKLQGMLLKDHLLANKLCFPGGPRGQDEGPETRKWRAGLERLREIWRLDDERPGASDSGLSQALARAIFEKLKELVRPQSADPALLDLLFFFLQVLVPDPTNSHTGDVENLLKALAPLDGLDRDLPLPGNWDGIQRLEVKHRANYYLLSFMLCRFARAKLRGAANDLPDEFYQHMNKRLQAGRNITGHLVDTLEKLAPSSRHLSRHYVSSLQGTTPAESVCRIIPHAVYDIAQREGLWDRMEPHYRPARLAGTVVEDTRFAWETHPMKIETTPLRSYLFVHNTRERLAKEHATLSVTFELKLAWDSPQATEVKG